MKNKTYCTWAINNFPTQLKNTYAAWLRANRITIRDHLEYLIAKTLRENNVTIASVPLSDIVKRIKKRNEEK